MLAAHPKIGPLLLTLVDDPSSTKVWAQGAAGGRAIGAATDRLDGVLALHNGASGPRTAG